MPNNLPLLMDLVGAFAPQRANKNFISPDSVHAFTPQDALDHYNGAMNTDYGSVEEAQADGVPIDNKTRYHDSKGNDLTDKFQSDDNTPMQKSSWFQRAFNPRAANAEDSINTRYKTNPIFANQDNQTSLNIKAGNLKTALPAYGKTPTIGNALNYAAAGSDGTAGSTENAERAGYDIANGVPSAESQSNLASSLLAKTKADNLNTLEKVRGSLGYYNEQGLNDFGYEKDVREPQIALDHDRLQYDIKNAPSVQRNTLATLDGLTPLQIQEAKLKAQGGIAAQPDINEALGAEAKYGKAIAGGKLNTLPYDLDSMLNEARMHNYMSVIGPHVEPLAPRLVGDKVIPSAPTGAAFNTMLSPEAQRAYQGLTDKANPYIKPPKAILDKNGKPVELPDASVYKPKAASKEEELPANKNIHKIDYDGNIYKNGKLIGNVRDLEKLDK